LEGFQLADIKQLNLPNMQDNNNPGAYSRRRFFKTGSLAALAGVFAPHNFIKADPNRPLAFICDPTTPDIQGPYYLPNAPSTTVLAGPNEPGTRLFIAGKVFSNDCTSPVQGAKVEVWQANAAAVYDNSASFKFRGTMFSAADGSYGFETIHPGPYLNGSTYRPAHIHFKVTYNGTVLVTQLYFQGDPYISNDPWASDPAAAERIIPLNTDGNGVEHGVFDISMNVLTGTKSPHSDTGYILQNYPNPFASLTNIHYVVFRTGLVGVDIFDGAGALVRPLVRQRQANGRYTLNWDGADASGRQLPNGVYPCVLSVDSVPIGKIILVRQA